MALPFSVLSLSPLPIVQLIFCAIDTSSSLEINPPFVNRIQTLASNKFSGRTHHLHLVDSVIGVLAL